MADVQAAVTKLLDTDEVSLDNLYREVCALMEAAEDHCRGRTHEGSGCKASHRRGLATALDALVDAING